MSTNCCERQFFSDRIAVIKAQIILYENAIDVIAGGVQSYTLDTGQSRQTVTKANLADLNRVLDSLYNRLATFLARVKGCGVTHVRSRS